MHIYIYIYIYIIFLPLEPNNIVNLPKNVSDNTMSVVVGENAMLFEECFDVKPNIFKRNEAKSEILESIPCPICGMGETGTHNHYGGRACTSCRAFFRRSVQTNSYKVSIIIMFDSTKKERKVHIILLIETE